MSTELHHEHLFFDTSRKYHKHLYKLLRFFFFFFVPRFPLSKTGERLSRPAAPNKGAKIECPVKDCASIINRESMSRHWKKHTNKSEF